MDEDDRWSQASLGELARNVSAFGVRRDVGLLRDVAARATSRTIHSARPESTGVCPLVECLEVRDLELERHPNGLQLAGDHGTPVTW